MPITPEQRAEIDRHRAAVQETRRVTVAALEKILYEPFPVLDHGFVRVIDYMGDDSAIVQAARVSYGRGTRKVNEDAGLIRYLMRHRHTTPFEMCELKVHVKLPIFVARQWIRHRTANVNEYSARYSVLDREFYLPPPEALGAQSSANRQGRGTPLPPDKAHAVLALLRQDAETAYRHYEQLLAPPPTSDAGADAGADGAAPANRDSEEEGFGLARELARINLPLNFYTQWYWKIDLHNLLHFLALRADPHAQAEIRAYADTLLAIVQRWVPATFQAFRDYRLEAATLSGPALRVLRRMLAGESVEAAESGLSPREWRDLQAVLADSAPAT